MRRAERPRVVAYATIAVLALGVHLTSNGTAAATPPDQVLTHLDGLHVALRSGDEQVRVRACRAAAVIAAHRFRMPSRGGDRRGDDAIMSKLIGFTDRALADTSESVVREALLLASEIPSARVLRMVIKVVERRHGNASSLTVAAAIRSFASLSTRLSPGQRGPVDLLVGVLARDPSPLVRSAAALGLARLGHPAAIPVLAAAAARERNSMAEAAIRAALSQLRAGSADGPKPTRAPR